MSQTSLHTTFINPPREFGILPFWFWNDDLEEAELLRQIHEFYDKGFGGFLIHPRVGLSRRVGYLTNEYFRLVKVVVEEAARLGMKVVLYDEGSYPSGSAAGQVVAENPAFAARCIIAQQKSISGPARGYWHPNPGRGLSDELLAVVAVRELAPDHFDPASLTLLPVQKPELASYDLPEGNWRLVAIWHVYSGGTIRGIHAEEDDKHALAPAAGDLLNPEAVDCFIRLTHERYYSHLKAHFGKTVVAMFTDEPSVLGRGAQRGPNPWPYTPGFLEALSSQWDEDLLRWLPALWLDCGERTEEFRQFYTRAVYDRLGTTFYAAQGKWCQDHGIALTGHPAESNDFAALRYFQWPGQDMVWRWVTPGSVSALEGAHSCAPKCASSAAFLQQSKRNATEVLGAYGWQLTLDEAKWLLDWHLVRGNNLFFLHAAFYSLRGRRAYESEPDIAIHNLWWHHFQLIGDYLRRVCWLLSDCEVVCAVAIFSDGSATGWAAAKVLYQNQIDFLYVDDVTLQQAMMEGDSLRIGRQRFQTVICDPPLATLPPILAEFATQGGLLLNEPSQASMVQPTMSELIRELLFAISLNTIQRDLRWEPLPSPPQTGEGIVTGGIQSSLLLTEGATDLRVIHVRKDGWEFYYLVNEGEAVLEGAISLVATGALEMWDPLQGTNQPWAAEIREGRLHTHLCLQRRQGLILAVDPAGSPQTGLPRLPIPGECLLEISTPWQAFNEAGEAINVPCPGDWAQVAGWETFAGTLRFRNTFTLLADQLDQPLFLDLGDVGDIAEVIINGEQAGVCAWAPYVLRVDEQCCAGVNHLEVRVTNSIANFYEGLQLKSGLLGREYLNFCPTIRTAFADVGQALR